MRIVAGKHRGRRIEAPPSLAIRPTADRVREALFSMLTSRLGGFAGRRVLDGFAGTGALGLEALSRGAERAIFVDLDPRALDLCRRNAAALGERDRAVFLQADLNRPPPAVDACDLVLLDPPYGSFLGAPALAALSQAGWLADNAIAAIESEEADPEPCPPGFTLLDTRRYGRTAILLLRRDAV